MSAQSDLSESLKETLAPLYQRWVLLEPREQNALRLLSAFVVLLILVYGIWLPLHRSAEKYHQQYDKNRSLIMQMQSLSPSLQSASTSAGGSILGLVSGSAASNALTLTRIEPEGDGQVRVWLDKADFNRISMWLTILSKQGVNVKEIQVERQADNGVSARMVLTR